MRLGCGPGGPDPARENPDNVPVIYLIGEWVSASVFLGLAFLVAALGVVGLGWWVLRGDSRNRRVEMGSGEEATEHR